MISIEPTAWDIWTQAVIPGIGAFGTILVSGVAVWATLRIAQGERAERQAISIREEQDRLRADRMDFGLAALTYFESAEEDENRDPVALTAMLEARHRAQARSGADFFPVQIWLEGTYIDIRTARYKAQDARDEGHHNGPSVFDVARMTAVARERLIDWIQTGETDLRSIPTMDPRGYSGSQ